MRGTKGYIICVIVVLTCSTSDLLARDLAATPHQLVKNLDTIQMKRKSAQFERLRSYFLQQTTLENQLLDRVDQLILQGVPAKRLKNLRSYLVRQREYAGGHLGKMKRFALKHPHALTATAALAGAGTAIVAGALISSRFNKGVAPATAVPPASSMPQQRVEPVVPVVHAAPLKHMSNSYGTTSFSNGGPPKPVRAAVADESPVAAALGGAIERRERLLREREAEFEKHAASSQEQIAEWKIAEQVHEQEQEAESEKRRAEVRAQQAAEKEAEERRAFVARERREQEATPEGAENERKRIEKLKKDKEESLKVIQAGVLRLRVDSNDGDNGDWPDPPS